MSWLLVGFVLEVMQRMLQRNTRAMSLLRRQKEIISLFEKCRIFIFNLAKNVLIDEKLWLAVS